MFLWWVICDLFRVVNKFEKVVIYSKQLIKMNFQIRAFSIFGEKGKYILSGGNDKSVKAWNWSRYLDIDRNSSNEDILPLNINLSKKVSLAWIF